MNYQIRGLQLSLIVHAAAIILLILAGNHFVSAQKRQLLVIDFTQSDSPGRDRALSVVTGRKGHPTAHKTVVKKQEQQLPLPEPEPSPPEKQRADPLKEDPGGCAGRGSPGFSDDPT